MNQTQSKTQTSPHNIHTGIRWCCALLALALFTLAVYWFCDPPERIHLDKDINGAIVKQTESPAEITPVFIGLIIAAGSILLYGINGYRLTKFAAGGVEAESENALGFGKINADQPKVAAQDSSVDTGELDISKVGAIYWLASDLMWTYDSLLRKAPGKYVLHGMTQCILHLRNLGFAGSASERSLTDLRDRIKEEFLTNEISNEQRVSVASFIKNLAHQIGVTIESREEGFESGLEDNPYLTHEERMKRIGR